MDKSFALVGCGKAGLSVGLALKAAGWTVRGCMSRTDASSEKGAAWLDCHVLAGFADLPPRTPVILAVPDQALPTADRAMAAADLDIKGRVVLHLSGGLPARVLHDCRMKGAIVGSFHPVMALTDPLTGAKRLRQAVFALEGRAGAVAVMKAMAQSLSGRFFLLSPRGKTLYHAAAVTAANHVVALLADSEAMLLKAGTDAADTFPAFQSLVEGVVADVFSAGPVAALTGPVERADLETVKNHLQALKRWPDLQERYRQMALRAAALAGQKHPDRKGDLEALEKLLLGWHSNQTRD